MTDSIFVYLVKLPPGINEAVLPCLEGYTIYIDSCLTWEGRQKAYDHAMEHIENGDFEKNDVQKIEHEAHKKQPPPSSNG